MLRESIDIWRLSDLIVSKNASRRAFYYPL